MSRLKRSRALLRNLRKQARKGTLSAREQQTLLNQEKKFRKAARRRRRGIGAGLGAALGAGVGAYLASPAFASLLERGADAAALRRELKKQGASEEDVNKVENAVKSAPEGSSTEEIVKEVEEQVAPAAEERVLTPEAVGLSQEEFDASRARELSDANAAENLADQLEMDRMRREELVGPEAPRQPETRIEDIVLPEMEEIEEEEDPLVSRDEPVLFSSGMQPRGVAEIELPFGAGLRGPDPAIEQRLAAARESMRLRDNERSSENMRERAETLERLRREGGFDPFTGEYVDSDRQQRIDDAFDEDFMREAFTDEERAAERENARLDAMDDSAALDAALNALPVANEGDFEFGDMGGLGQRPALTGPNNPLSRRVNVEDPGLRLPIVDIQEDPEFFPEEEAELLRSRNRRRSLPGVFGPPLRTSGPRVQAMGGKNPKMADLMKKVKAKYGIR